MARHSFLEEWEDAGMALLRPAAASMGPTELLSIPRGGSESASAPKKERATKQAFASQKGCSTLQRGILGFRSGAICVREPNPNSQRDLHLQGGDALRRRDRSRPKEEAEDLSKQMRRGVREGSESAPSATSIGG